MGQKRKLKKTGTENIKKLPTPEQLTIKINDIELLSWKTKHIYDNCIKGGHVPHCHDRAHKEGLHRCPKFLMPLT